MDNHQGHNRFYPDGQQIAFPGKDGKDKCEVWVIENFRPEDIGKSYQPFEVLAHVGSILCRQEFDPCIDLLMTARPMGIAERKSDG